MILIVDDQKSMCWILSKILSEAGFLVETTQTAEEALLIAANNKIRAAIIDYRLPDKNGFDLFLELKKCNPKILGVLISSYGSKELREKATQLGFYAYFDKPFQNQAIVTALQAGLEKTMGN
ncbi:response regulator [Candidatus Aerophobetes bacterium]|nr:response regulator [Candidatus Aerophobetes bacterium]